MSLSRDEQQLARIMFVNRALRSNGQAFQQLFWAVKQAEHGQDFTPIRPQGAEGDGGNDGFLATDGHYFQVYGPVDPLSKIRTAASKLVTDFAKLIQNWHLSTPIKKYSFVFNDKYEGAFPDIVKALKVIEASHPGVTCRLFTIAALESDFLRLPETDMHAVLGAIIPDPARIVTVDYSVLTEVISHIVNSPASAVTTRFGDLPELSDKIRLNHLCSAWADLIRNYARLAGHVDLYFAKNSTFLKQSLKDHLVNVYAGIRDNSEKPHRPLEGVSVEDLVFDNFRRGILPNDANRSVQDAVDIIIGFYFEACDIFDPNAAEGDPSASPR